MTERERFLRNVELRGDGVVPCNVYFSPATWDKYRDDLEQITKRYPDICEQFDHERRQSWNDYPAAYREGELLEDNWGCVWENVAGGLEGQVKTHPMADYAALKNYTPPDPLTQTERGEREDWVEIERKMEERRAAGQLVKGHIERFYERVHFLRGYESFLMDVAEERPELDELINLVLDHNMKLVHRWLDLKPDLMGFGDDLGMQDRLQIRPSAWRRYFKTAYTKMFRACRDAGAHVFFHCDGYIVDVMSDLIECGVTILNPQDRCNGLDNIARELKGKICTHLDLDRQGIIPFGTPAEIDAHIKECIVKLGSPKGGLSLVSEINPTVSIENVEAVCNAMIRYREYHAKTS